MFLSQGAHRFTNLFETIRTELESLTSQLKRINEYEYLYSDSEIMQELFFKSYINMLRFWNRVDKECNRCRESCLLAPFFPGPLLSTRICRLKRYTPGSNLLQHKQAKQDHRRSQIRR